MLQLLFHWRHQPGPSVFGSFDRYPGSSRWRVSTGNQSLPVSGWLPSYLLSSVPERAWCLFRCNVQHSWAASLWYTDLQMSSKLIGQGIHSSQYPTEKAKHTNLSPCTLLPTRCTTIGLLPLKGLLTPLHPGYSQLHQYQFLLLCRPDYGIWTKTGLYHSWKDELSS